MFRIIYSLIFITLSLSAYSQPKGYVKITDDAVLKSSLKSASSKTKSLKSNFTQVKIMSLLDEEVTSVGIFLFQQERKVRMEYTSPFKYLMVINGNKIQIKDRQKTNSFTTGSNKLFSSINNIMVDCMTGNVLDNAEFTNTSYQSKEDFLVELSPVKRELKDFFDRINVYINKIDFSVNKIEMIESMGDVTIITFTNKKINIPIDEKEFTLL